MTAENAKPKLITFDGEARSGKGTIAHYVKRELEKAGTKVMLTDRGQIFRVLVVAATERNINFDDPAQVDSFLRDPNELAGAAALVKKIYDMSHEERDALLYTNLVGENSAKMGGRPLAQAFSIDLMEKWFRDAGDEGVEVILLDGRALENKGINLESKGLCDYVLGLYFICDPQVGARRTLGYAATSYGELTDEQKHGVDAFVKQINVRNNADKTRAVQRLARPKAVIEVKLPNELPVLPSGTDRIMAIIDTSADMNKDEMCLPVMAIVDKIV